MSSFYDLASLVVVPSGYQSGKIYAQKPLSTDGELTFSRASSATRVGPDGLIEKVRTNVVLQSNSFDTTWATTNATVTSGQAGYDGTNNAWELNSSASGGRILQSNTQAGLQTFSVYAKGSVSSGIRLYAFGTVNANAYFNLNLGTVGVIGGSGVTAKIEAVDGGWYRCSISFNQTNVNLRLYTSDNANAEAAGTIYIQNAQLEAGDIATDYIATTSAAVSVGPVANLPRLDYLGATCGPRLNLEPQRTNAITFSEQMDNAAWIKNVNAAVTANQAISPDGYQNADLVSNTLAGGNMDYYQLVTGSASTTYTYSVFVKAATHTKCALRAVIGAPSPFTTTPAAYFDLATASVIQSYGSATNAKIEAVGSNGWYRVSMTFPTIGTSHYLNLFPLSDTYSLSASNAPLNYSSTGGVYFWGAQYEIGAYATSYIGPTLGASVTRLADSASKTGISSLIGQTEGTLFWDFDTNNSDLYKRFSISNSSTVNWIFVGIEIATGTARGYVRNGGSIQADIQGSANISVSRVKIALAYKANDFALYVNGEQIGTDNSGTVPTCSSLDIGSQNPSSAVNAQSDTNQALLFKTRLSNADLATLTTI
jgi:hypothetical protein